MKNLVKINLQSNVLTGPIPPELAKLKKLQELRLDRNKLQGIVLGDNGTDFSSNVHGMECCYILSFVSAESCGLFLQLLRREHSQVFKLSVKVKFSRKLPRGKECETTAKFTMCMSLISLEGKQWFALLVG